ncbi:MAG: Spx/MgsR family RNA polymerase-binding regulatory protein [Parvularculaceae bacterium]
MATLDLYGLKTCDTCKRARKELDAAGVSYAFHDVREDGLTKAQIAKWAKTAGWEAMLNKASAAWRALSVDQKASLAEAKAVTLMAAHPALIKRPLIVRGVTDVHVGWTAAVKEKIL